MSELEIKANAEQYALKRIASTDLFTQARDKILIQDAYEKGFNDGCAMTEKENKELKILISSLVYEINQIWDINEMDENLRKHAEKIHRGVVLSKMAEDNRIILNALGFALVPPKPKANVKEI